MVTDAELATFCDAVVRTGGLDPTVLAPADRAALEELARSRLDEAASAFPFAVPLADFTDFVSARVDPSSSPAAAIAALAFTDLYLACGCVLGLEGAAGEFVGRYSADIRRVAGRFARAGSVGVDDLVQIVTTRLLLPSGERPPRLSLYRGQGPMAGFVRVTAARLAINTVSGPGAAPAVESEEDLFSALVSPSKTPEAEVGSEHLRERVREAFVAAVARLSARDRNILHYSLCDGLSIDVIARMYSVHRATAARWITSARDELVQATRLELRERLAIPDAEVDTLLRGGLTRFELSVARVLRGDG